MVLYGIWWDLPSGNHTWLAGKSPSWMEVLRGKSQINGPVSIAMFDYRRVMPMMGQNVPKPSHNISKPSHPGWKTHQTATTCFSCIGSSTASSGGCSKFVVRICRCGSDAKGLAWALDGFRTTPICICSMFYAHPPTYATKMTQMKLNIPFIEHIGIWN